MKTTDKLLIGVSEVSIVPKGKKISLDGQFYQRLTDKVLTPITFTCVIIKKGDEQATFLSADLAHVTDTMVDDIRDGVKSLEGYDPSKIIMNATHTHTSHIFDMRQRMELTSSLGLATLDKFMEGKKYIELTKVGIPDLSEEEARAFLVKQGIKAVKDAYKDLHPAHMKYGFGRAAIGLSRRACFDDDTAAMWGDTNQASFTELENGPDTGIELCYIFGDDKKLETILCNIACPSQALDQKYYMSADFWGEVKILVRKKYGKDVNVLALTSAAGDLCPRDLIRWVEPEEPIDDPNINHFEVLERNADPSMCDVSGVKRIGKRIMHEIEDTLEELKKEDPVKKFEHRILTLDLPLRRVTRSEYNKALANVEHFAATHETYSYVDYAAMHGDCGVINRFEAQQKIDTIPTEVHIIRIGEAAYVSFPFELFVNYGNQIRARSRAPQTFLIQLANGAYGYLPTATAERHGHYSGYVASGFVGHEGGDILVRTVLDNIREMFPEK